MVGLNMAGLLGPDQWTALGLLGGGLMQKNPGAGFGAAFQYLDGADDRKRRGLLDEMRLQEAQLKIEEAKRQREFMQNLPDPTFLAGQQGLLGGGGPTMANAANVPAVSPVQQLLYQGAKAQAIPLKDYIGSFQAKEDEWSPTPQIMRKPDGSLVNVLISKSGKTKEVPYGVKPDVELKDTGGSIVPVDKNNLPAGFTLPKTGNPFSDLVLADGAGGFRPNAPLMGAKSQVAAAGAPKVNLAVNTDKSYFGNVAEGLAKNDVAAVEAARSAPERVQTAQRVKDILSKNPITGTGADVRLSLNKALATAGIIDGKNVADTEVLAGTLATQALDAIKSSGLGGGSGFSNADREFLERARAGKIDMTPQALGRIADLNERAARETIKRGNSVIGKLRQSPQAGQMGQMLDPVAEPPAATQRTVKRTGTYGGKKVIEYTDGTVEYAN
jgi:hypothetical protein